MFNVSSHMLRSRQITLKCLYSYLIYYDWALWSDYHAFLLLTYYPARVCESYNFNYRAYNMIQARQCTLRNDLLVLIVREKGQPFLNNFGTSCISPNFLTCKHSHKWTISKSDRPWLSRQLYLHPRCIWGNDRKLVHILALINRSVYLSDWCVNLLIDSWTITVSVRHLWYTITRCLNKNKGVREVYKYTNSKVARLPTYLPGFKVTWLLCGYFYVEYWTLEFCKKKIL